MRIISYITPSQVKGVELTTGLDYDDETITRLCLEASRDLELLADGLWFYPYRETRYYDQQDDHLILKVDKPLLEVVEAVTANGTVTLTNSNLYLKRGKRYGTPANRIDVNVNSLDYFLSSTSSQRANYITGEWGFIEDYESGNSWLDTNVTLTAISGNDYTVTGLSSRDALGLLGSIDRLSLIRWRNNDTENWEYDFVTSLDDDGVTMTVYRAVNGSSALTLDATASIQVFRPLESLQHAARRLVGWYYRQKDHSRPDIDRPIQTNSGTIMPSSFPADVTRVMHSFTQVLD